MLLTPWAHSERVSGSVREGHSLLELRVLIHSRLRDFREEEAQRSPQGTVFQIEAHLIPFAYLLGFCQGTNHLNNLNLSALICRMGIITILRFSFFKKKDFIHLFILERGGGREKGRETSG